ncbi:hypothetical protein DH2020_004371 [Rehmannia glutinosa]|uniref:Uncharacterized protein n=1 Tax=Rehmannia glutinosa TaxID=99300 RepID=A0ABR0XP78_REHGL
MKLSGLLGIPGSSSAYPELAKGEAMSEHEEETPLTADMMMSQQLICWPWKKSPPAPPRPKSPPKWHWPWKKTPPGPPKPSKWPWKKSPPGSKPPRKSPPWWKVPMPWRKRKSPPPPRF